MRVKKRSVFMISLFVLLSLSLSSFALIPQKAQAQGVFVPVNDIKLNVTASLNVRMNTGLWTKEYIRDLVAYSAAQAAINVVVTNLANKILKSVNSIVRDLQKELTDLTNKVSDELGVDIQLSNTCFPQFPYYQNSAWNKFKFRAQISCTFSDTGVTTQEFYNDFSRGGWAAYRRMAFQPQNNPFGLYIMTQNELAGRTAKALDRDKQELGWGKGVRPLRDRVTGIVKIPGSIIQGQLDNAFSSQIRRMENADELTEIVSNFVGGLVTNAINEGVF